MTRKRSAIKRFRDWFIYQIARGLLAVGGILPARIGYAKGWMTGSLAYLFAGRERRKILANLQKAFGDEKSARELKHIARRTFIHFGVLLFELLKIPRLNPKRIRKTMTFEGLEMIQQTIASGRGVVIATGHIGNWELMGAAAAQLGIPVNVIARKINDERLNDLVIKLRAKAGIRTIMRESPDSAKQILRCLKRGEMLALLIDQDLRADGAFVPFFGRAAYTPVGAAALAQRAGALFAAAAVQRLGPGRHQVRVKEIKIDAGSERDRAIIDATARATAQLESWIREMPHQWAWNHNRWRTRPEIESGMKSPED